MISFILIALTSSKVFLSSTDERNFLSWMRENGEFFTGSEYHFRLGVFLSNSRFVTEFNRNTKNSFRLSLNHLACWTHAEYRAILGHSKSSKFERSKVDLHNIKYNTNHLTVDKINQRNLLNNSKYHKYAKFSKSVDWREKGESIQSKTRSRADHAGRLQRAPLSKELGLQAQENW